MAADKNYDKILEEVCEKLNSIDSIKDLDLLEIKNSVESIENLVTNTQASINFQEIKEKLENISLQFDSCNNSILKDIFSNLDRIKEKTDSFETNLENIVNIQSSALTTSKFEEYKRQQLDLALKTNENILNILKKIQETQSSSDNKEHLNAIENKVSDLHKNLSGYIEQIVSKLEAKTPESENISAIMKDISSVNQHSIKQTGNLIKMLEMNFNSFKNKEFADQVSKIKEIYDSLDIINAWIEKVGFVNKSIENVYARLGANIDFDDVSEKIDIIYENISALNDWAMKIDNIDETLGNVNTKVTSLESLSAEIQNIGNEIKNVQENIEKLENFELNLPEDVDFEDIADKLDIIYENLVALNDWANKIDMLVQKSEEFNNQFPLISDRLTEISEKFLGTDNKLSEVHNDITRANDNVLEVQNQALGINDKLDETNEKFNEINDNLNNISQIINETDATLSDNIPGMQKKLDELSQELHIITRTTKNETESYVYTLLDIESDFLKLHQSLDNSTEKSAQDLNSLKEKVESDFLNLHQSLDNSTEKSTQDLNSIKAKFEELNDDISSISKRTNKLILSADDANKEFKTHLEAFKETIAEFDLQRQILNPEEKFNIIGEKLAEINQLAQNNIDANNSLSNAFAYLAEWVDATGSLLNSINDETAVIKQYASKDYTDSLQDIKAEIEKNNENIDNLYEGLNKLDEIQNIKAQITNAIENINTLAEIVNSMIANNDLPDIKSTLSGILMQLTTSLSPDIDYINEKIDRLSEEQQNKFSELEILLKEKSNIQEKKIIALEEKIDNLYGRVDKLIEAMSEQNSHDEVKDILNYITTQITETNETLTRRQTTVDEISKISSEQKDTQSAIQSLISNNQALIETQQKLLDNQQNIAEKQQQLSENQEILAAGQKFIADKQQQLSDNQKTISDDQQAISNKIATFDNSVKRIVSYIEDDDAQTDNEDKIIKEESEAPIVIAEEVSNRKAIKNILADEETKPDTEEE